MIVHYCLRKLHGMEMGACQASTTCVKRLPDCKITPATATDVFLQTLMSNASPTSTDVCLMVDNGQEALHACMICGKSFSDYDSVQAHYRNDHQHKQKSADSPDD
jgi:phenolic acid decarboxylase